MAGLCRDLVGGTPKTLDRGSLGNRGDGDLATGLLLRLLLALLTLSVVGSLVLILALLSSFARTLHFYAVGTL